MSLLLPLLIAQTVVGGRPQDPSTGQIDVAYDRRREVKFSGTVTGKTKGSAPGKSQGMSILVKTGKMVREVELGPAWFVGRQEASVGMGDKVTVTGMPVVLDHRQRVVIARQIMRGRKILALRDMGGDPYWTFRRKRVARQQTDADMGTAYTGTVGAMQMFDVNGVQFAGYTVQTPNGPVNVAVAPDWYWNNQPQTFDVGQQVTFYGQPNVIHGNGVVLANSATYEGGAFVLRPGGVPVYGGFRLP